MMVFSQSQPVTIVCYGDSNTRYYNGDQQKDGNAEESYPTKLQQRFTQAGYSQVRVLNCGYPDMQTDFALEHFSQNVLEPHADFCIYGFGTNCVRQPDADLEQYLEDTSRLFTLMKQNGVQPLALTIPWFAAEYCGIEGQQRLPGWNANLAELCLTGGVPLLDTYSLFQGAPELFFSEVETPKRHYSAAATQVIANLAFDAIAPYIR